MEKKNNSAVSQTVNAETVGNSYKGAFQAFPGYEPFFEQFMNLVKGKKIEESLGTGIYDFVTDYVSRNPLPAYDNYLPDSYARAYVGRCEDTGWEAIVMSWTEGNPSTIHGHPTFAMYYFLEGEFKLELFEKVDDHTAKLVDTLYINEPKCLYAIGPEGRYDNHIHRISCVNGKGRSLHIYSDDALKGHTYTKVD